jgi:hypothetical protein
MNCPKKSLCETFFMYVGEFEIISNKFNIVSVFTNRTSAQKRNTNLNNYYGIDIETSSKFKIFTFFFILTIRRRMLKIMRELYILNPIS